MYAYIYIEAGLLKASFAKPALVANPSILNITETPGPSLEIQPVCLQ